jgi:hypothetical protein
LVAVHLAQAMTYLRLTGCPAALLINFNVPRLMDGVRRLINVAPRIEISEQTKHTDNPPRREDADRSF